MKHTPRGIQFLLRLNDDAPSSPLDLFALRERLNTASDNCRIVLEGLVGSPSPKVIGVWTPPHALVPDELPGYTMSYTTTTHPLRSAPISIPRIHPFSRMAEWRDAALRAAEDWAATAQ